MIKLYDNVGTEVFGNNKVMEILGCLESTATSYIKRLNKELELIVLVVGLGKGKYKFYH